MRDAGIQVLPLIAQPGEPLNPIFENLTGKRVDALLIQGSIARKEEVGYSGDCIRATHTL